MAKKWPKFFQRDPDTRELVPLDLDRAFLKTGPEDSDYLLVEVVGKELQVRSGNGPLLIRPVVSNVVMIAAGRIK